MTEKHLDLTGKVALVTGAARGIGQAIANSYAEAGADVAICDLPAMRSQLDGVADTINTFGRKSLVVETDTSRKTDVDTMVDRVMDGFGTIDILVNNAGILIRSSLLTITEDDWDRLMGVDLKGYFLCSQAIGRVMMKEKKGNIINISTQHAFKAFISEFGPYGIAKAGVAMMTRYLAKELGEYGIRVNGIAPGIAKTDFSKPTWSNVELLQKVEAELPLKRMADVEEIADVALFLASDDSRYVTGHTILMEGGSLA